MGVKKKVEIDERAAKELVSFSEEVQARFFALFKALEEDGFLTKPYAKKITSNLFELRVRHNGQWRAIYVYVQKVRIVILSFFAKKTQKTPKQELHKALKRFGEYI